MNVSIENKLIWLSPERTAGRFLSEIFKNYGFCSCDIKNKYDLKPLGENPPSHGNTIPENFNDFRIIVSIRNPYDRVWSYYVNHFAKNFKPREIEHNFEKFNEFVQNIFIKTVGSTRTDPFFPGDDYFNKWRLNNIKIDKLIRFENLQNDVLSLDFIKKSPNLFDHSIFSDKRFINKRFLSFDTMYDLSSAQKVFNFYKNHFFSLGYDPFSFTKENLTDEQKIDFIHGN